MGRYAHLVMGPAGSGKSTYCKKIQEHCAMTGRTVHIVNLDPAAEDILYTPSVDIRELISLEDVMEELQLGPNGGLIYCMEFLGNNFEWVREEIGAFEEDYILIDCPGQVELYTHLPVMKNFIAEMTRMDYRMCAVYLLDSHFITDSTKFLSGGLMCLSAMIQLELPHINVLSKMDMVQYKGEAEDLEHFLDMELNYVISEATTECSKFSSLTNAIGVLLEQFNLVSFVPLNIKDEDTVSVLLQHVEHAMQYGEDQEPKEPNDTAEVDWY
mmetsp:Transcript_78981/g.118745  ORF Transcript_78981/g.118745 Transcript_78981/m.118745 type:complete len:270 (+) Transcript_78981:21-830(+)|eukprot:CAMPEP_0117016190 /NCGR_PEP_ID=MMETSP0472-20121206/12794_1 /TAXON_ID=693140 ORGANISM="Tiarina fusus, Strain LIS" /NCGR_SAMPLE_ID=MMETSP0472 /ASSEMBLY_ACC=CAM_ASM_000603 /LENGTH=269 /DNA_ID=CAMNT_0004720159 /DNA_START=16 /DNA_END=825 /DNA_ORIENTATION=+